LIWVEVTAFNCVVCLDGNTLALVIVNQGSGRMANVAIKANTSAAAALDEWLHQRDQKQVVVAINGRRHPQLQTAEVIAICKKLNINIMPVTAAQETAVETMNNMASAAMRLGRLPNYLWWRAQIDAC
jgi:hypothetical protein